MYSWGFNLYNQTNNSISGDLPTPQEFKDIDTSKLIGLSAGFFHTAALIEWILIEYHCFIYYICKEMEKQRNQLML